MLNKKELKELTGKSICVITTNNSIKRGTPIQEQIKQILKS